MTRDNLTSAALFVTFLLGGIAIGLNLFAPITTPINVMAPPIVAPDPVDRDLVVGISEVLVEVHAEAKAAKTELEAVKTEARQIIQAMLQEIQRLQEQPTVVLSEPTLATPTIGGYNG